MDYLYFACDWLIQTHVNFYKLMSTAEELKCVLVNFETYITPDKGYRIHPFAIQVSSKEALDDFIGQAGHDSGLTLWYPISREQFEKGYIFNFDDVDPLAESSWFDGMLSYGLINEEIKKENNE